MSVDSESAINILFYNVFIRMKLPIDRLTPIQSPFYKFTRKAIIPEGIITLPVLMGATPK